MKKVRFSEKNQVCEYELTLEEKMQKKEAYHNLKKKRKSKRKRKRKLDKINIFFMYDPLKKCSKIY
jgi:hypothetical protein